MKQGLPPGGSSTIYGVRYQMLWSLLRTTELRVSNCTKNEAGEEFTEVTLRLEPIGGGGDLQEINSSGIIVEQVKARFDGGAWSLREVIDEVLPDLYRSDSLATQYRFITEGKMGGWGKVYDFFRSLNSRVPPDTHVLDALDNENELHFARLPSQDTATSGNRRYWQRDAYTERSLFSHIVAVLRNHKPAKDEPLEETHGKVWHLLGNFEMVPPRSKEEIESAIDASLLAMGCPNTSLETTRRAMLDDLMARASSGSADIHTGEFLSKYGLSVPITKWLLLRNACTSVLRRYLRNRNYNVLHDVRLERVPSIASNWTEHMPTVVLSGESGQGKTWSAFGTAYFLSEQRLVVAIDATGDADSDIDRVARVFCEDVWGLDTTRSLNRISARLRSEKQNASPQWLTLCVDGVQNADEARNLAQMDWEGWGVRLLVSCSDAIADVFERSAPSRVKRIAVTDFTLKELHACLSQGVGINWPHIPQDVRDTLRRPLLAGLYCTIATDSDWRPTNEYSLYSRYWQLICEQEAGAYSTDAMLLGDLAARLLIEQIYPWPERLLHEAGIDNAVRNRLVKAGWLHHTPDGCWEILHSRLLNWAVAEGIVATYRARGMEVADLIDTVRQLFHSEALYGNQNLGYVPMDVLWLLTGLASPADDVVDRLILALEQDNWQYQSALYQNLLPSLGERIIPALVRRLELLSPDDTTISLEVYKALSQFSGEIVAPKALRLLEQSSPAIRRRGCRVFANCPSASGLDRLWAVCCDIHQNPTEYALGWELDTGRMSYRAEEEGRDALTACIPLHPEWMPAIVEAVDPATAPVLDLPHMTATLEERPDIWQRCKVALFAKVPQDHDHLLAWNIYIHRDAEAIVWLQERIRRASDWGATKALAAITRIDPDLALKEVSDAPIFALGLKEIWCFSHLLLLRPEETRACILRQMQHEEDPWNVAMAYSGSQDAMDVPTLELLLHSLETLLDRMVAGEFSADTAPLYSPLRLLCGIHRLELLECFARRRGSSLEEKLTMWLLGRAELDYFALQHDAADALTILSWMDGEGYIRVVNRMITSPSIYARYDGLNIAHKRPDAETIRLLEQVSLQEVEGNSRRQVERARAILALARCEEWSSFISGVVHSGFQCPAEIGEEALVTVPLDDAAMAPAFVSLESQEPEIGAILAVGLGQRKDKVDVLCDLLASVPADSPTAQACVQALGCLGDSGERIVHVLEAQLLIPGHYRPAWIALLKNGSNEATDVLLRRLTDAYDHTLAINLLHRPRVTADVVRLMQKHLASAGVIQPFGNRAFEELTAYVDDETLLSAVLQEDNVQEHLRASATAVEAGIWYTGTKAAAIRALSVSDREEAYESALAALRNPHSRDRERYPEILMHLHEERAVADLLEQMPLEKATAVRWAIGRTLAKSDLSDLLTIKFQSSDSEERIAACQLAGYQPDGLQLEQRLLHCANDSSSEVMAAAEIALRELRTSRELNALIDAYHSESKAAKRWSLLDAILNVGDPGEAGNRLPQWIHRLSEGMSYLTWIYVRERLGEERKKREQEAQRQDFFNRQH